MSQTPANQPSSLDFSDVLAAAIHDMKNSLSLLLQSIETLGHHVEPDNELAHEHISRTHYEAARLNSNLVQMLMLYRSETGELPTNVDECSILNVFDDICASNQYYCEQRDIKLVTGLDDDIFWYFDHELVYLMLNDAVVNALRYGKSHVKLNARTQDIEGHLHLVITIEDDGDGYPASMLSTHENAMSSFNVKEGRTGLGMYFARMIAYAHDNDGLRGEISLSNGGTLSGSVFTVMLP